MAVTELGHEKDKDPGHGVGSIVVSSAWRESGRAEPSVYMQSGCLIRHSTQGWGKPTTGGRT